METLAALWTGYDSIIQHMSELGGVESPYMTIMNVAGFMGVGILILIFSYGFFTVEFTKNTWYKLATVFLWIAGIFMVIVGFFPCDAGCIDVTTTGQLHSLTSIPQSIALPLAIVFAAFGHQMETVWNKSWFGISLVLGFGSLLMGPLMSSGQYDAYVGLLQRIGIGFCLLWIGFYSVRQLKSKNP
ncbi:MAG: DUF998 domain-containing protein [Saprospiraceae bacterium]|nr:DUF998 domain-containing protein [Saprospiraceae bacterium]